MMDNILGLFDSEKEKDKKKLDKSAGSKKPNSNLAKNPKRKTAKEEEDEINALIAETEKMDLSEEGYEVRQITQKYSIFKFGN